MKQLLNVLICDKILPEGRVFMPKFFIKNEQINDNRIVISGEDVNHIANVLRMKIDDELQICDIDTSDNYVANISEIGNDMLCFKR